MSDPTRLHEALDTARQTTREQLEAAWCLHVGKVEETLHEGWQERLERIFEERFAELSDLIGEEVERRVAERTEASKLAAEAETETAFRRMSETLAQAGRRLREVSGEEEVAAALLDAACAFAPGVALFVLQEGTARLLSKTADAEIALSEAPALREVLASGDCVVARHDAGELSAKAVEELPAEPGSKVTLLPVHSGDRIAAVLYAERGAEPVALPPLEVLAALAGVALGRGLPDGELVTIAEAGQPDGLVTLPEAEQERHVRAMRMARVRVAELRLEHSGEVKAGRTAGDLYVRLKKRIDEGRDQYRKEFLEGANLNADYLHQELVRTLANGNESLLGAEYPGALV